MKKIFPLSVLTKEPVELTTNMKGLICSLVLICISSLHGFYPLFEERSCIEFSLAIGTR